MTAPVTDTGAITDTNNSVAGATIADQLTTKIMEIEVLESALRQSLITWTPLGIKAADSKAALRSADGAVVSAQHQFTAVIDAVRIRDLATANNLFRLHNVGKLTRTTAGSGSAIIDAAVKSSATYHRATKDAVKARTATSDGCAASALSWRDVLGARDALGAAIGPDSAGRISRTFVGPEGVGISPPNARAQEIGRALSE